MPVKVATWRAFRDPPADPYRELSQGVGEIVEQVPAHWILHDNLWHVIC